MLGCSFEFKVRTHPRARCASVIKVSDVPQIMTYVKSLIRLVEVIYYLYIMFFSVYNNLTLYNFILYRFVTIVKRAV